MESSETTEFRSTLFGTKNNIFTVCIVSVDNSTNTELSEEENRINRERFEYCLRSHKFKYYIIEGQYKNEEYRYVIPNINLDTCEHYLGPDMFNQKSFIFGEGDNYSSVTFTYYKQNSRGKFEAKDKADEINTRRAEESFFFILMHELIFLKKHRKNSSNA